MCKCLNKALFSSSPKHSHCHHSCMHAPRTYDLLNPALRPLVSTTSDPHKLAQTRASPPVNYLHAIASAIFLQHTYYNLSDFRHRASSRNGYATAWCTDSQRRELVLHIIREAGIACLQTTSNEVLHLDLCAEARKSQQPARAL